jgi:hypothetical protein
MVGGMLVAAALSSAATLAQTAPPAPSAEPPPTAWACTRQTLVEDRACTVEGRAAARAPSREQAKENRRQARALAEELCAVAARSDAIDPDPGVLRACTGRIPSVMRGCGGDGSRQLLDDAGRFNPGHARCYGALAALVRETQALFETASTCCACIEESCGGDAGQCVERVGKGALPQPPACLADRCAAACAELQLAPRKP